MSLSIADWRLPIGRLAKGTIENRQLKIGNAIGRYRSRTVSSVCAWTGR